MKPLSTVLLSLLMLSFAGCKKDKLDIHDGTYEGTFTVSYDSLTLSGQTTLELDNGRFVCSGNTNRVPAGGSGSFSFSDGIITFHDENFWTADFDWNLILNGKYDYSISGKELTISAERNGIGTYRHVLIQQ